MKKEIIQTIKIITLSLLLSSSFAFAWTAPTTTPPPGNQTSDVSSSPINQSATLQLKSGALGIGPLGVTGTSNLYGNVSILPAPIIGGGGGPQGSIKNSFSDIFASFKKSTIKPFNNILTSLFKINIADASFIIPSGPAFNYVYPQGTFDPNNSNSAYYPDGNTQYPIAKYSGTPPNDMFIASTASAAPSFKVYTDKAGGITFTGGCLSSTTSIPISTPSNPTTITLYHLYNGDYNCSVILTVPTNSNTELPTTTLQLAFSVTGNPIPPPPPGGDLYVTGKIGVGTTTPTEKLDVVGTVKVGSLEDPNNLAMNRLCADLTGKIVSCPTGYQPFSATGGNWSPSLYPTQKFTVPDGVFRINVSGHSLYVYPKQVIYIGFDDDPTSANPSSGTYFFGTYLQLVSSGIYVAY